MTAPPTMSSASGTAICVPPKGRQYGRRSERRAPARDRQSTPQPKGSLARPTGCPQKWTRCRVGLAARGRRRHAQFVGCARVPLRRRQPSQNLLRQQIKTPEVKAHPHLRRHVERGCFRMQYKIASRRLTMINMSAKMCGVLYGSCSSLLPSRGVPGLRQTRTESNATSLLVVGGGREGGIGDGDKDNYKGYGGSTVSRCSSILSLF